MQQTNYLILSGLFLFFPCLSFSQHTSMPSGKDTSVAGTIIVSGDARIPALVERHKTLNESKKGVPGYRVQLFFGSRKQDALDTKGQFLKQFSDKNIYLLYEQPYFKVRAGDFLTRLETLKFLNEISLSFPNAFVVKDDVMVPELEK